MWPLEGLQHIADEPSGRNRGRLVETAAGSSWMKAVKVLGGLVLLAEDEGVVLVEDVAVAGGEDDLWR